VPHGSVRSRNRVIAANTDAGVDQAARSVCGTYTELFGVDLDVFDRRLGEPVVDVRRRFAEQVRRVTHPPASRPAMWSTNGSLSSPEGL
jgi:hypothetical protein